MVGDLDADAPAGVLHRLGWEPDPLAWPPRELSGGGRFDDPSGRYRVLYTAEQWLACFVETLAAIRPGLQALSLLAAMPPGDTEENIGEAEVPADWHHRRMIGSLRLAPGQRWLELRTLPARQRLRRTLAPVLQPLGYTDLDAGDVLSRDRLLTMIISRWAHEQEYRGIAYPSRLDPARSCWAIFEGAEFTKVAAAPLVRDDADLRTAAALLSLRL